MNQIILHFEENSLKAITVKNSIFERQYDYDKVIELRLNHTDDNYKDDIKSNRWVIYGSTFESACAKLTKIKDNIDPKKISQYRKSKNDFFIELVNGDYYRALAANPRVRGYKFDYAFIDEDIPIGIFNNYLLPTILKKHYYYKKE